MRKHIDLQNSDRIKNHIKELHDDYVKTRNPIVAELIEEWQIKYINKLNEETK